LLTFEKYRLLILHVDESTDNIFYHNEIIMNDQIAEEAERLSPPAPHAPTISEYEREQLALKARSRCAHHAHAPTRARSIGAGAQSCAGWQGSTGLSQEEQQKLLPYSDSTTLKPSEMLSTRTSWSPSWNA
jgi:hypothetical protein